mgnify:CR=1 FL=1
MQHDFSLHRLNYLFSDFFYYKNHYKLKLQRGGGTCANFLEPVLSLHFLIKINFRASWRRMLGRREPRWWLLIGRWSLCLPILGRRIHWSCNLERRCLLGQDPSSRQRKEMCRSQRKRTSRRQTRHYIHRDQHSPMSCRPTCKARGLYDRLLLIQSDCPTCWPSKRHSSRRANCSSWS